MIYDNRVHPVTRARIPRGRKNGSLIAIVIDNGYRARDVCSTGVSTVVKARLIECTLQLGLDNGRWSGTLFTLPNAGLYAPKIPRISSVVQIRISLSLSLSLSLHSESPFIYKRNSNFGLENRETFVLFTKNREFFQCFGILCNLCLLDRELGYK